MKLHFSTLLLIICLPILGLAQTATIKGIILDDNQTPISDVSIKAGSTGSTSNENGFYLLKIPANTDVTIEFTHLSYKRVVVTFNLKNGQEVEFNPVMDVQIEQIATVVINTNTRQSVGRCYNDFPRSIKKQ